MSLWLPASTPPTEKPSGWIEGEACGEEAPPVESETGWVIDFPDCDSEDEPPPGASLLTDLVAHWKLNEATGSLTWTDATGRGNDLVTDGYDQVQSVLGKIGNAPVFDGNFELIGRNHDDLKAVTNFTFAGWVYFDDLVAEDFVFGKNESGNNEYEMIRDSNDSGKLIWYCALPGLAYNPVKSAALSNGQWYHFIVYHDATRAKIGIQINGGTAVEANHVGGVPPDGAHFAIGYGTAALFGKVDSLSKWDRLLNVTEKALLANVFDVGSLL